MSILSFLSNLFSSPKKEITFENLYQILGAPRAINKNMPSFYPQIEILGAGDPEKRLYSTNEGFLYDHESYIRHIEKEAPNHGLEIGKHIIINKTPDTIDAQEVNKTCYLTCEITVRDLNVVVGKQNHSAVFYNPYASPYSKPSGKSSGEIDGGVRIIFRNNRFFSSQDLQDIGVVGRPRFELYSNFHFAFFDNDFKNAGIALKMESDSTIELDGNDIEYVFIKGQKEKWTNAMKHAVHSEQSHINDYQFGYFNLPKLKDFEEKMRCSQYLFDNRDIVKALLYAGLSVKVDPHKVAAKFPEILARLKNNSIRDFYISHVGCSFNGKNTINRLQMSDIDPLYWGPYQNIDPDKKHAHAHRSIFIDFKNQAAHKNDKIQELYLQREIIRCENALIQSDNFWRSLQDRIIFAWSGLVSKHGVSWARAVLLLALFNAFFASYVAEIYIQDFSSATWFLLFAKFFNPLSSLADVVQTIECNQIPPCSSENCADIAAKIAGNVRLSLINVGQKVILGIFIYEIVKIFRRFSK